MNKKILIPAALAAVTVTLTGCATAESVSAPSTSTSVSATWAADEAIRHAVGLGATGLDATAARVALESGRPYLVGLPDGVSMACHSALLAPGDAAPWILNRSAAPTSGIALDRWLGEYGCGTGVVIGAPTTAAAPTAAMDATAAEAAQREGKPFIYAIPDGANPVCNVAVLVAGKAWFLNRSGGPSAKGDALSQIQDGYGCTNGETVPGVPAN